MGKAIIIGAGGVGSVVAHKCAQHPEIFTELVLASRTKEKCDRLAQAVEQRTGYKNIVTDRVDADKVPELVEALQPPQTRYLHQRGAAVSGPYHNGCLPGVRRQLSRHGQL